MDGWMLCCFLLFGLSDLMKVKEVGENELKIPLLCHFHFIDTKKCDRASRE